MPGDGARHVQQHRRQRRGERKSISLQEHKSKKKCLKPGVMYTASKRTQTVKATQGRRSLLCLSNASKSASHGAFASKFECRQAALCATRPGVPNWRDAQAPSTTPARLPCMPQRPGKCRAAGMSSAAIPFIRPQVQQLTASSCCPRLGCTRGRSVRDGPGAWRSCPLKPRQRRGHACRNARAAASAARPPPQLQPFHPSVRAYPGRRAALTRRTRRAAAA